MTTPCIIITRDRVSLTRRCVASLEVYDELEIHLVDHGSTWPQMLDYLAASSHPVHYATSRPPQALWEEEELARIVGTTSRYLVTDPDVVLDADCPSDWLHQLNLELDYRAMIKNLPKVGLGLRIDNLPPSTLTDAVCAWERGFWVERTDSGKAWKAPVDTTLALYRPLHLQRDFVLAPAARLDAPYLLQHLPWYEDSGSDPEIRYYREHLLPGSSHWAKGGWQ